MREMLILRSESITCLSRRGPLQIERRNKQKHWKQFKKEVARRKLVEDKHRKKAENINLATIWDNFCLIVLWEDG